VVRILIIIESAFTEDEELNSEQQVALNPINMSKLSLVTEQITVSGLMNGSFFNDEPFSRKHPPSRVLAYSRFSNSFLSQLMKTANNKIEINIFFIAIGLGP